MVCSGDQGLSWPVIGHNELPIIPENTQILHTEHEPTCFILIFLSFIQILTQNVRLAILVLILVFQHEQPSLNMLEVKDLLGLDERWVGEGLLKTIGKRYVFVVGTGEHLP